MATEEKLSRDGDCRAPFDPNALPFARQAALAGSFMATLLRGGVGVAARPAAVRPTALFELYEYEGCPYCRLVREALTELDLDALVHPCPKGGKRFRPRAIALGGQAQFPFFVDPNTNRRLYESADIINYLFETYAHAVPPPHWQVMPLQKFGSMLAAGARLGAGVRARPSVAPDEPLELYSFEASPFARPVRERLSELELPYVLRAAGRRTATDWVPPRLRELLALQPDPGTNNRRILLERAGRISIPTLFDPNTATVLGDSGEILDYLDRTYAR